MGTMRKFAEEDTTTTEGAKMSASEMLKEAGFPLAERAKIAAAIVALNEQREVHGIMTSAAEIQKTAALQGVTLDDETCIKAAADVQVEVNMQKRAALEEQFGGIDKEAKKEEEVQKEAGVQKEAVDWSKIKGLLSNPAIRIPGAAAAGGGIGVGGAALAGADSPQELALAGLLGGTLGAAGGLSGEDLTSLQQFVAAQKAGPLAGAAGKFVGQTAGEAGKAVGGAVGSAGKAVGGAAGSAGKAVGQGATDLLARIRNLFSTTG